MDGVTALISSWFDTSGANNRINNRNNDPSLDNNGVAIFWGPMTLEDFTRGALLPFILPLSHGDGDAICLKIVVSPAPGENRMYSHPRTGDSTVAKSLKRIARNSIL